MTWQPIETIDFDNPIWVLKYDIYFYPKGHAMEGNFCSKDEPNAQKFTDCHGWYDNEADALAAMRHFREPNSYRLEKVYRRVLK